MAVEKLALYPADSLHISKTLNPFDIPNTICLNCDNYQCTCLMERFYCQTINGLDKNRGLLSTSSANVIFLSVDCCFSDLATKKH